MSRNATYRQHSQAGFLIPLALILLVGISFLAIAINRLSGQTGTQSIVEGLSVQAFYAAESGAQYGMHKLLFNVSDRTSADSSCASISGLPPLTFTVPGLTLCSVSISCTQTSDAATATSFYRLNSRAQCGAGQLLGEREIEVSAFMQ